MTYEPSLRAVNFAILKAHRLGEPRVLELTAGQLARLRAVGAPEDWREGRPTLYRGLRIATREASVGRVLVWDRARETEMAQVIAWPAER